MLVVIAVFLLELSALHVGAANPISFLSYPAYVEQVHT